MMSEFILRVLSPSTTVWDAPDQEVVAAIPDGWIGVRAGHSPFQARLLRGNLVIRTGEQERILATLGGVIAVTADSVTVLTGAAAVDSTLEALEADLDTQVAEFAAIEQEAERHFTRIFRTLADSFRERRS